MALMTTERVKEGATYHGRASLSLLLRLGLRG